MRKVIVNKNVRNLEIETVAHQEWHLNDGICIDFMFDNKDIPMQEFIYEVGNLSKMIEWMSVEGDSFLFNLEKMKNSFDIFIDCKWMKSDISIKPNFEKDLEGEKIIISFTVSQEEIEANTPKKIFLSHKGADKQMVRKYFYLLKELGFDPWLDEDAMVAGAKLNRGILKGFEESCAAVFFVTPLFKDEDYLEDEVDYAIDEKKSKKDKFSIITLALKDGKDEIGVVPDLLRRKYVYKEPTSELEAFREIIRALPIVSGKKVWKK